MFNVTPKDDFADLKAGTTYLVLDTMYINTQLKVLTHDDSMDISLLPAEKFKLVLETGSSDKTASTSDSELTPQQKAAITRQKNKKAQEK